MDEPIRGAEGPAPAQAPENPADAPELTGLLRGDTRLQSQFDRLVTKALQTARGNWERERAAGGGEPSAAPDADRERALAEREAALRQREQRYEAASLLMARGLPGELADCVPPGDADALREGVERVARAFRQSVDGALRARLTGEPPKSADAAPQPSAALRRAMGLRT